MKLFICVFALFWVQINGKDAALWAQCGGNGYSGPTSCTQGSVCEYYNDWYSQCVPSSNNIQTTTTATITTTIATATTATTTKASATTTKSKTATSKSLSSSSSSGSGNLLGQAYSNVPVTFFTSVDSGGSCQLPVQGSHAYSTSYSMALGTVSLLGNLAFNYKYCGHVVRLDCGNGPVNIMVENVNPGNGLDLVGSTWTKVSNNMSPTIITSGCTVQLTDQSMFSDTSDYQCYFNTAETTNAYYHKVGLYNTGGKLVVAASITSNGALVKASTSDNAFSQYFALSGQADNNQITFYFDDGTTYTTTFDKCAAGGSYQTWS